MSLLFSEKPGIEAYVSIDEKVAISTRHRDQFFITNVCDYKLFLRELISILFSIFCLSSTDPPSV
jgi:hypothetical protein